MAKIEKATFELSITATKNLRKLKALLEADELAVKQRDIVDYLLRTATLQQLQKHFSAEGTRRIGVDELEVREKRRARYRKQKADAKRTGTTKRKRSP